MNLQHLHSHIRKQMAESGLDNPELCARIILKESLEITDADIVSTPDRAITKEDKHKVEKMVNRRLLGEPVSRILGRAEFWGLPFILTPNVLDPRPETETIVEIALKRFSKMPPRTILDLGTGSGCILIALLHEFKQAKGVGVDICTKALEVAQQNAKLNGVEDRSVFLEGNWQDSIEESFDLIVSNPPYIPNPDINSLAKEVKNHDPILALDGGIDGLESYRKILETVFLHETHSFFLCLA